MKKPLNTYKFLIFDVDGTIYFQQRMRFKMLLDMIAFFSTHPWCLYDLAILRKFRKMRSDPRFLFQRHVSLYSEQFEQVSLELGISRERVQFVVEHWLYKRPLEYVYEAADVKLVAFIKKLPIGQYAFYSDYPAQDKLSRLGIKTEHIYDSTQPEINALKPNPDGLLYIMKTLKLKKAECLMIGDRDDRDGECARRAGIDYCILPVGEKDRSHFVHNNFFIEGK